jgi:hypothetical protein
MNELALFGWRTVCAVEYNEHARDVLVARQNDGSLEPFPIWDDVRTLDCDGCGNPLDESNHMVLCSDCRSMVAD